MLGLDARFAESEHQGDGLSITEADWLEILQSIGLADAEVATVETGAGAALLLTAQLSSERASVKGAGTAVLVGEDEAGGAETMSAFATLLASSGLHVSLVLDSELGPSHLTETPALIVVFSHDADTHVAPAKRLLDRCLRLKRLADCVGARATTLWVVTSGAITSRDDGDDEIAAGFWAFTRTLANEVASLDIRRVDVARDVAPGESRRPTARPRPLG